MRNSRRSTPFPLVYTLFLAAGCGDDRPSPRPGDPVASGRIEHFQWLGPSAGLLYTAWSPDYGAADLRIVDLARGVDSHVVRAAGWEPRPAVPPGGASAAYYVEPRDEETLAESRVLRAAPAEAPDTVLDGIPWISGGLAVTADESQISFAFHDSIAIVNLSEGTRRTWPVWGTDAVFSPDGGRLLVLYRWSPQEAKLVDLATGVVPLVQVGYSNLDHWGAELRYRWAGQTPHALYVDADGAVLDHDLVTGRTETLFTLPDQASRGDVAWSPDGRRVVYRTLECIDEETEFLFFEPHCVEWAVRLVMRDRNGREEVVAVLIESYLEWRLFQPSFSPDGTRLAYLGPGSTYSEGLATSTLYVVELP